MNSKNASPRGSSSNFLSTIALVLGITFCTTTHAQVEQHGGAILKNPVGPGPNGTARVGDTITVTITVVNLDITELNGPQDALLLTSIMDVVHHANGDVTSPNLLIPGSLATFTYFTYDPNDPSCAAVAQTTVTRPLVLPVILTNFNDSVTVTTTYTVQAGDENITRIIVDPNGNARLGVPGLLEDDAIAVGCDLRSQSNTRAPGRPACVRPAGGNPDDFLLTFPGQVTIVSAPPPPALCVIEAVSDRFNSGGSDHAVWMPGISTNLIFTPNPAGCWTELPNGTATLTGRVHSRTNVNCGFDIDVHLSGRTTSPPPGSPKHDPSNDPPADTSTWYFYPTWSGTLTGFGPCWEGAILQITRSGAAWQVGVGANLKNVHFGASAWFTWTVTHDRNFGPPLPVTGEGDFNIDIFPCSALGDFVWADINADGCQQAGEPGVPGVEVRLTDCAANPRVLAVTSTDANGHYLFPKLAAGSYKIQVVPQAGTSFITPNSSLCNDTLDSDFTAAGFSPCITLAQSQTNLTVDAGLVGAMPLLIAPRILSIQLLGSGLMRLQIQETLRRNYIIEGSENMVKWKSIATVVNVNGTLQFRDTAQPSHCFYRVKRLP